MNTATTNSTASKTVRKIWLGADVSEAKVDITPAIPDLNGEYPSFEELRAKEFARSKEGARLLLKWLDHKLQQQQQIEDVQCTILMEATGNYSREFGVWLVALRPTIGVAILNPAQTHAFINSLGLRNKTDSMESRALARFGVERKPVAHEPIDPLRLELRAMTRYRVDLVEMRVAEENRLTAKPESAYIRQRIKSHIKSIQKDIERIECKIKQHLENKMPAMNKDVKLHESIFGIGWITAVTVLAELGDLRQFERARQVTAFAGLSPKQKLSGLQKGQTRICKQGSKHVRKALWMPAQCAATRGGDSDLARIYRRMCNQGKTHRQAVTACMRRLLVLMRAISISGEPYQKNYTKLKKCGKLGKNYTRSGFRTLGEV